MSSKLGLFSYGTLQQERVQLQTYGRLLEGTEDALCGYRLERLPDRDPEAVRISGLKSHLIVRPTGIKTDRVAGMVYFLSPDELEATDRYEGSDYRRVVLELESGRRAFVYLDPMVEEAGPTS